jgi:hypothetical protein
VKFFQKYSFSTNEFIVKDFFIYNWFMKFKQIMFASLN